MRKAEKINTGDFIYIPSDNTVRQVITKTEDVFGVSFSTDHEETKEIQEIMSLKESHLSIPGVEISEMTRRELNIDPKWSEVW